ncbi:MAG: glycosyltransferase family 4 protein [Bacteroidota bacterium]
MNVSAASDAPRAAWKEALKRPLVRSADAGLVGSEAHASYLVDLGLPREVISLGYNVVDNVFFREGAHRAREAPPPSALPALQDSTPYFIASNRFVERKNLGTLLKAYAEYRQRTLSPWRLLLLGDGPLRADLEIAASDGVEFCGFQKHTTLPTFYGRAGAFVHPSRMDQWALVVNEAMAAGLPVLVSTGSGCYPYLVEPGRNGWTFAPDDAERMTTLLLRLTDMPASARRTMGEASQNIVARFGPERFAEGLSTALHTGAPRSTRGLTWSARLALAALRVTARHPMSFHAITE